MLYTEFTVGEETYKLRLTTKGIVKLEKLLGGRNPLTIYVNEGVKKGEVSPMLITNMIKVFYASLLAFHPDITEDKAYEIFDNWLEEHTSNEFAPIIVEIYQNCGLFKRSNEKK